LTYGNDADVDNDHHGGDDNDNDNGDEGVNVATCIYQLMIDPQQAI